MALRWLMTAVVLLGMTGNAAAQSVRVVDGDTISLNGESVRIWGIDAPETKQACADRWMGGQAASSFMRGLVEGRKVECEDRGRDRYGWMIGLCRADGRDLGAEMVEAGMAWAFVRYSRDYVDLEGRARAAGRGVYVHQCEFAWEWRARQKH